MSSSSTAASDLPSVVRAPYFGVHSLSKCRRRLSRQTQTPQEGQLVFVVGPRRGLRHLGRILRLEFRARGRGIFRASPSPPRSWAPCTFAWCSASPTHRRPAACRGILIRSPVRRSALSGGSFAASPTPSNTCSPFRSRWSRSLAICNLCSVGAALGLVGRLLRAVSTRSASWASSSPCARSCGSRSSPSWSSGCSPWGC